MVLENTNLKMDLSMRGNHMRIRSKDTENRLKQMVQFTSGNGLTIACTVMDEKFIQTDKYMKASLK